MSVTYLPSHHTAAGRTTVERVEQPAPRDERLHLARELHDVIGYGLAAINIQAAVAASTLETDPITAAAALDTIQAASAEALAELRTTLGQLRNQSDGALSTPSLDRLDELAARVTAAGVPTRVEVVGTPRPLPPEVDLAAFRIAQEALANVMRHAGAAQAVIVVRYEERRVVVEIVDDGNGPAPRLVDARRPRHGIVGMSERAAAIGGSLEAGARDGGGFRVRAELPLGPRP